MDKKSADKGFEKTIKNRNIWWWMKLKRKWIIALLVIASILTGCAKKEDPVEVQYENLHEKVSETMELEGNFSVTMNVYID